jgi:general secretion pathway protein H
MRISETGLSVSSRRSGTGRSASGFTLIEVLVVVLIIGIMVAGTVLSLQTSGQDRELDKERDRILALSGHLRDKAALENREYGIRCFIGGYEFLVYEPRGARWEALTGDLQFRPRKLPPGIEATLEVEGRPVILPPEKEPGPDDQERTPQIMLYSSGEMSLFEWSLRRSGGGPGVSFEPDPEADRIKATDLEPGTA